MTRREWLANLALAVPAFAPGPAQRRGGGAAAPRTPALLDLKDFQPRSMLQVAATRVPRARMPVIDFHTHFGTSAVSTAGVAQGEEVKFLASATELLAVMDRVNLRMMVNLTGGVGRGLQQSIERYQTPEPDHGTDIRARSGRRHRTRAPAWRTRRQGVEDARPVFARARHVRAASRDR